MGDVRAALLAYCDETEAVAAKATPGPWYWDEESPDGYGGPDLMSKGAQERATVVAGWGHDWWGTSVEPFDMTHIARHDPSSVLAQVAALRVVIGEHLPVDAGLSCQTCGPAEGRYPCLTLLALADGFVPGWRES